MCGIVGILGKGVDTVEFLLESLSLLEYRGYDSAGIATISGGEILRCRAEGKLINLRKALESSPIGGEVGIGHTRWATHGGVSENNAHPHMVGGVAIVHNGIIENYGELLEQLSVDGGEVVSETDSEIIAHLLDRAYGETGSPDLAMSRVLPMLRGAFAFVALFTDYPERLYGGRHSSPLVIGYGDESRGEIFFGSDALSLAHIAERVSYLEDGDWAELRSSDGKSACIIYDRDGVEVERDSIRVSISSSALAKGNYRHYMLKEIYEQPTAVSSCLSGLLDSKTRDLLPFPVSIDVLNLEQIALVACGTSYYAGMIGSYWFQSLFRTISRAFIASEFRYSDCHLGSDSLAIFLSQSGETMDSLSAMKHAKDSCGHIVSVVNVEGSSMDRLSDASLFTHAGPEIGVASTKSFTSQLVVLLSMGLSLARSGGFLSAKHCSELVEHLLEVPSLMEQALRQSSKIEGLVDEYLVRADNALYLGRGSLYPLAMEAALKLKEVSYIHAEGCPAGEMKHGPIALIDEDLAVIFLAPMDKLFAKNLANIQEVVARGGKVIVLSDEQGLSAIKKQRVAISGELIMPSCHELIAPIIYALPVQMLAYYTAYAKGTDVDQPRNLAKSVTVE